MKKTKVKAFTFTELLIVCLIVVVAFAMIIPVTNAAGNDANKIKCTDNLRKLTQMVNSYAADNKDYVFTYDKSKCSWAGDPQTSAGSPYLKYAKSQNDFEKMRACPLSKVPNRYASYGMAGDLGMFEASPETPKFFTLSEIGDPKDFYLFMEMNNILPELGRVNCYRAWWLTQYRLTDPNDENPRFAYRHDDMMLVADVAGGVSELGYATIADDKEFIKSKVYRDGMYGVNFFR